jgi:two-component system, cell cycle response regulator DivK
MPSPRHRRSAPLILIADDNEGQRYIYASYLEYRGLRVETAPNGEVAITRALASSPDVIVMDLTMPWLDGWEATTRLKADPRTSRIPVIACSAHAFGKAVERALIAGCDAYLAQPCRSEDLYAEITRHLAASARRRTA